MVVLCTLSAVAGLYTLCLVFKPAAFASGQNNNTKPNKNTNVYVVSLNSFSVWNSSVFFEGFKSDNNNKQDNVYDSIIVTKPL